MTIRETKLWYGVLGRACVSLLFAVLVISDPWMRIGRLATLFAVYALADAALALFCADRVRRTHAVSRGRTLAIEGVVSAVLGVLALVLPPFGSLRIIGALRAVALGGAEVAWSRRGNVSDLLELSGIAEVAFGIVMLAWPGPGLLALPWLLGVAALVSGALAFAGTLSHFKSGAGMLVTAEAAPA